MRPLSHLSFCSGLLLGLSALSAATSVVHERREVTSSNWVKRARVSPSDTHVVRIGLAQSNLEEAHDLLMDVSNPSSPNYAKFYSADEVAAKFAPSTETVNEVQNWLTEKGINASRVAQTKNHGWLVFHATSKEIEDLFDTTYYEYHNKKTGKKAIACEQYHVPDSVQKHIDYVHPGVNLNPSSGKASSIRRRGSASGKTKLGGRPIHQGDLKGLNVTNCDHSITPDCIRALYKIPSARAAPHPNNSLGIFEEGDYYAQEDLDLFFKTFAKNIPGGTHPIPAFIDGAEAPVPVGRPTDDANWASNTTGFLNTFLDALDGSYCTYCAYGECGNDPSLDPIYPDAGGYDGQLMCGVFKPTNVISVSYGEQENDLPANYQQRQCTEFLKLGLQGVSVLFASGDNGVAGPPGDGGSVNGCLNNGTVFSPAFPNSCPYITNVGATKVYPGYTVSQPESAVYDPAGLYSYASGGGFSNIYPIPDYQADAVATYFKDHNPPYPYYEGAENLGKNGGLYNRLGRGYPDVAANGDNIAVFNGGEFGLSGGTSASTPIFAAIINRIIDERLAVGKGPVGFINPVLYKNPSVLNDITNGTNPGCGTDGFATAPGWDPATGLGTPNYPKMLKLWLDLP
ncbi:putative protease S8 tripeptidyl peptidase I [Aspergillus nomiae NRRL 13137]|uniref:Putative protease S8 tripeptidyl peptidase I n=1 Tax=Aspergillus nomiae NRRL (strain ATCC 15546 / NRRL 13137 / CBS 260.88 / M93) TaxID=1509407 RepID=A0A0L1JIT9_ASPN3|nr:putative protease S8 tripeptidyl peptidase I [Aspergillus nomiae NRRL 13137]KNG91684.1 putative protease S8 tripeptidyl peptidase I [Aspergillus nomiae NRRL 13137]